MVYTHDKYNVYAGETKIATTIVGKDGDELAILQGMSREKTKEKIFKDCPEFCEMWGLDRNKEPNIRTKL